MGLEVVSLKRDLEGVLKRKVDLVSYNGISKYLKQYILENQVPIL
jgi:predicted nucleotidyltransferase